MTESKSNKDFGLISIIMAAYNAGKTIGSSIQSVIDQTYAKWELLIIDDCSTDDTLEIARDYADDSRIRIIRLHSNLGVSMARKAGLQEAKGDWIAILDSDDLWDREKLEKQISCQRSTGAKLLFTGSGFIDENDKQIPAYLKVPDVIDYRMLLRQNLISNSSVLVQKKLYEQNYAMGDRMHEDYAVWLSITKRGIKAYGINEPLLTYRLDRRSKSGNKIKAAKMNWNTYRYCGLNRAQAILYMCFYTVRGLKKYGSIAVKKRSTDDGV